MKFTQAWAEVASQNLVLKIALAGSTITSVVFAVVSMKLAMQEPLVFERACYTRHLKTASPKRTDDEIQTFALEALAQRFDTAAVSKPDYLSVQEMGFREIEQRDLKNRKMLQRVLVNSVSWNGKELSIDADRVITVGSLRSVLPMPMRGSIESQSRSDSNPYGLKLLSVTPIKITEAK